MEIQAGEAIRGSDSQLCPKPPPKPSKVPSMRLPRSPRLQRLALVPPTPPPKPQQQKQQPSPEVNYCELSPCSPPERDSISGLLPNNSYVERLRTEEARKSHLRASDTSLSGHTLDRSSYHHAIEALEDSNEEDEGEAMQVEREKAERDKEGKRAEEKGKGFRRPVFETSSAFRPGEFESRLLPSENKPLEMSVLKRSKELLLNRDHRTIAKHILQADCQVGSHLSVFSVLNGQNTVASGN